MTTKRLTTGKRPLFQTREPKKKNFWTEHIWEILSFLIPMLLMIIAFAVEKIHPFGDRQYIVTDNWHQYYPFFQILHEKLQTGGSLLYSWRSGLGTNFLAMMAYYAASPLNLLAVFVPRAALRDAFTVILLLKFAFAGLFFARMLRYVFKKNDLSVCMFSVMYALCSYMLGYYWNTIWLDTVALLPLVMLGLTALVREGKYRTYVISLAIALLANYYIAYFICIFTVLAFFCLCLFENLSLKQFGKRFAQIAGSSLLGAGLSAWILLPTFFALMLTHSANNSFPKKVAFYEKWNDIIANMLPFTEVTSKEGLPNIYCGWLPILLLGAFLIAKKIRIREKIAAVLLMVFLIVSCNFKTLNFIWHGFHFTNMLPYRFSFIFSFVVLVAAYRAYQVLMEEELSFWQWGAMFLAGISCCVLAYGSKVDTADGHKLIMQAAILGAGYLVVILLRVFAPKQLVQLLLAGILTFEMSHQAIYGVKKVGSSSYSSYPSSNADIAALLEYQQEQDEDLFYRTEITMWYTLNDPALYLYDGVSQFSSMANESVTTFTRLLGLPAAEGSNRYFYGNTSPLTNMMLGVKYVLAKDGYNADTLTMTQEASSQNVTLYRNNYNLPIGFMMDSAAESYTFNEDDNAFERQNDLFRTITGVQGDLFTQVDITNVGHMGYDVTRKGYGDYDYARQENLEEGASAYLKYNYTAPADGMMYAYVKIKDVESMDIYKNEEKTHRYNIGRQPYIIPLGDFKAGDKVTIRSEMEEKHEKGTVTNYVYYMNADVLEEGYQKLADSVLQLETFGDTSLSGTIQPEEDGLFYLSIPYEKGWTAYVDGKKTELLPVFGAMCGIPLEAGTHTIELRYCPRGFVVGLVASIGSAAILIVLAVLEIRRRKQAEGEKADKETSKKESKRV